VKREVGETEIETVIDPATEERREREERAERQRLATGQAQRDELARKRGSRIPFPDD
jgi:hypothetical protein